MTQTLENKLFEPINPSMGWDEGEFAKYANITKQLEDSYNALRQNASDVEALQNVGVVLRKDPGYFTNMKEGGVSAQLEARSAANESQKSLAEYIQNHDRSIIRSMTDEKLLSYVIAGLPLVKGLEGDLEQTAEAISEMRQIEEIAKDPSKVQGYVAKKLENAPNWLKNVFGMLSGREEYVRKMFNSFVGETQMKLNDLDRQTLEKLYGAVMEKLDDKAKNSAYLGLAMNYAQAA